MVVKCTKCIKLFQEQKRRLELIQDLKGKNEGVVHAFLKSEVCRTIREFGQIDSFKDSPISVDTEVSVKGIGKVDVVGRIGEETIAVECGNTNVEKILALEEQFDVVLHIPFCYTWNFIEIKVDEIKRRLAVAKLAKALKKRKLKVERNKWICVEEGECSIPSGRDGYPEEAMQIAGLIPNQE